MDEDVDDEDGDEESHSEGLEEEKQERAEAGQSAAVLSSFNPVTFAGICAGDQNQASTVQTLG